MSRHRLPDQRRAAMFRHPAGTAWTPRDTAAIQVWGPQDAIATAQEFHNNINRAEHGSRAVARPERHHRRTTIAVTAGLLALLIAAAAVLAWAIAQPDPQPITRPLIVTAVTR